uniref:Phospholipase/carboxylesterase/thioesterase domain-containing protein n=1 Tax=Guillardia theta TaxID=55529 RepID=A0A7S4MZG0_GUITH
MALEEEEAKEVVHGNLALCCIKLGRYHQSLEHAIRSTELNPRWAKGWARKASAHLSLGDLVEAEAAIARATLLQPDDKDFAKLRSEIEGASRREATTPQELDKHVPLQTLFHHATHDPPGSSNLLILLHGLGDSHEPFLSFGKKLELPKTSVMALRACDSLPLAMGFSWFPVFEADGNMIVPSRTEERRTRGLKSTLDKLEVFLRRVWQQEKFKPKSTFIFGFSQGAIVAVNAGLRMNLGGVVGVSGSLIQEQHDSSWPPPPGGKSSTPMLLTHGVADERVSITKARACRDRLRGWVEEETMEWKEYNKGHDMVRQQEEVRDLMSFFARHLVLPMDPQDLRSSNLASREDVYEVKDPAIIQAILMRNSIS